MRVPWRITRLLLTAAVVAAAGLVAAGPAGASPGTAPRPAGSPLPWLAVIAAGCVLTGAGVRRYRQARIVPVP